MRECKKAHFAFTMGINIYFLCVCVDNNRKPYTYVILFNFLSVVIIVINIFFLFLDDPFTSCSRNSFFCLWRVRIYVPLNERVVSCANEEHQELVQSVSLPREHYGDPALKLSFVQLVLAMPIDRTLLFHRRP